MHAIYPASISKPKGHYAPAIVHNDTIYVSGQISVDSEGKPILDSIEDQAKRCLEKIRVILLAANSDIPKIVKLNVFISNMDDWGKVNAVVAEFFGDHRPARIIVPCPPLHYGCGIEIDCIAAL